MSSAATYYNSWYHARTFFTQSLIISASRRNSTGSIASAKVQLTDICWMHAYPDLKYDTMLSQKYNQELVDTRHYINMLKLLL